MIDEAYPLLFSGPNGCIYTIDYYDVRGFINNAIYYVKTSQFLHKMHDRWTLQKKSVAWLKRKNSAADTKPPPLPVKQWMGGCV